jgi:hypothetical protein
MGGGYYLPPSRVTFITKGVPVLTPDGLGRVFDRLTDGFTQNAENQGQTV